MTHRPRPLHLVDPHASDTERWEEHVEQDARDRADEYEPNVEVIKLVRGITAIDPPSVWRDFAIAQVRLHETERLLEVRVDEFNAARTALFASSANKGADRPDAPAGDQSQNGGEETSGKTERPGGLTGDAA